MEKTIDIEIKEKKMKLEKKYKLWLKKNKIALFIIWIIILPILIFNIYFFKNYNLTLILCLILFFATLYTTSLFFITNKFLLKNLKNRDYL